MVATLPLQAYELLHSRDPDYTREIIGKVFVPHRLDIFARQPTLDARVHVRRLVDTTVTFVTYGGEVRVEPGVLDTFFTVHVTLAGSVEVECGSAAFVASRSVASVISPYEYLVMRWHPDSAQLIFRIERPAFEAYLAGLLGRALWRPLRFKAAMPLDRGLGASVSHMVRAVVHELDRGSSVVDHPLPAQLFEQSLMTSLLVAQPHNYNEALGVDVPAVGSRQVRLAVALLESRPEGHHTLASVATTLSISGRSLQRGFRLELDTSFTELLRDIRLRRVHDDLRRAAPSDESVGAVIARWGLPLEGATYTAYRHRFGETPAQTLRSLT